MQKVKRSKMCSSADPDLIPVAELLRDIERLSIPPSKKFYPCFNIPIVFHMHVEDRSDEHAVSGEYTYYYKELFAGVPKQAIKPAVDGLYFDRKRVVHNRTFHTKYSLIKCEGYIDLYIDGADPIFEDPYLLLPEKIREFAVLKIYDRWRGYLWNRTHRIMAWLSKMGYDDPVWTRQLCKSALALVSINAAEDPGKDWEAVEIPKMREEVYRLLSTADAMHKIYG